MNSDELSLQVGGQFGDHQAVARGHAGNFIAIGLRDCCLVEVDQARIGGRDLNALVTEPSRPTADSSEAVKRLRIADELRQKNRGPLHGGRLISRRHYISPVQAAAPRQQNTASLVRQECRQFNTRDDPNRFPVATRLQDSMHYFQHTSEAKARTTINRW